MAKDPSDIAETAGARFVLNESEDLLRDVVAQLKWMHRRLGASDEFPQGEVSKVISTLNQARSRLIDEVSKHEDRILVAQKRVAHAPLDFDALRSEIGCKIDRIRESLAAGGVPEEPEG